MSNATDSNTKADSMRIAHRTLATFTGRGVIRLQAEYGLGRRARYNYATLVTDRKDGSVRCESLYRGSSKEQVRKHLFTARDTLRLAGYRTLSKQAADLLQSLVVMAPCDVADELERALVDAGAYTD